jgi:hypothetical protein
MELATYLWIIPAVLGLIFLLLLLQLIFLAILPKGKQDQSAPIRAASAPVMSAPAPAPSPVPPPAPAYGAPQMQPMGYGSPPPAPAFAPPADGIARVAIIAGLPPQDYPLPGNMFAIGRFYQPDQNVLIGLDEKSVSRRHAQFRANPATREFFVQDLGSSYGTFVISSDGSTNRLQPNREEKVYNGDILQIGNSIRLRLLLPSDSRSAVTQL